MNPNNMTTSAAFYFARTEKPFVPTKWFERAHDLFTELRFSPVLFTANDSAEFLLDDCYMLDDHGKEITLWDDVIVARGDELVAALAEGRIDDLCLDSPRKDATDRDSWRAMVSVFSELETGFIGVDEQFVSDATSLIRRAYDMAKGIFNIRYGIGYKMPLVQHPDCYASGSRTSSLSDVLHMIRHRREWDQRKKTHDELWSEELMGQRRHLTGFFRGAYPASILSEAHVRSAALTSRGIGKLTELDSSLWLWELTDEEIPEAERMLESRGVLVRQVAS